MSTLQINLPSYSADLGPACTECGRCMEFCPASVTGKTLSPKHLMEGLRDQILVAETALAGDKAGKPAAA